MHTPTPVESLPQIFEQQMTRHSDSERKSGEATVQPSTSMTPEQRLLLGSAYVVLVIENVSIHVLG